MKFDINNIPLIISGVLLLLSVGLNILISLTRGILSRIAIIISVPAHVGMLISLFISGAPLSLAVACLLFSVLVLTLTAFIRYKVDKKREKKVCEKEGEV